MKTGPSAIALAIFVLFGCGKKVATIALGTVPSKGEASLEMPTGRASKFDVYVDKYERQGENEIRLQISLLKSGNVVATTECSGMRFSGRSSSGCQSTALGTCPITAPEGGADTIRAETRFTKPTPIKVEGVELRVRER